MRSAFITLAFAAIAAAVPAGVSSAIAPQQSPPPGCSPNYSGSFQISPMNVSNSKRDVSHMKRQANQDLGITLKNGVLHDPNGRTGYVAANSQFQFDDPPQAGAIFTSGFTVCQNGSLALGNTAIWFECLSGSFYNLYFNNVLSTKQCFPVYIDAIAENSGDGPESVPASVQTATYPSTTMSATSMSSAMSTPPATGAAGGAGNSTMMSTGAMTSMMSSSMMTSAPSMTTGGAGGMTGGAGGGNTQNGGGSGASSTGMSGGGSGASSSSSGLAPQATAGSVFGLAAGLLAFAVM